MHWQIRREDAGKTPLVKLRVLMNWQFMSGALTYKVRMAVGEGMPGDEETTYTVVTSVTSRLQVRP